MWDNVSKTVGLVAAFVSIVCFGSQAVHVKLLLVREARSPWLCKICFSFGVACIGLVSGGVVAAEGTSPVSKWGAYTACIYSPATMFMLASARRVGVGLATGLIVAFASLTSFVTGVCVLGNRMPDLLAACGALILMLCGIVGLVGTLLLAERRRRAASVLGSLISASHTSARLSHAILETSSRSDSITSSMPLDVGVSMCETDEVHGSSAQGDVVEQGRVVFASAVPSGIHAALGEAANASAGLIDVGGVLSATLAGVMYGCQGILLHYGDDALANGASMMCVQLPVMLLVVCLSFCLVPDSMLQDEVARFRTKSMWRAALLAANGGACFGIGFVGQVLALRGFGDAVGFPLTQANLVVAGLWSILVFREVHGCDLICAFACSGGAVVGGITLLATLQ